MACSGCGYQDFAEDLGRALLGRRLALPDEVEQNNPGPTEHCAGDLPKSADFPKRIIVPVGGQVGVTLSLVCPLCHRFPIEDNIWLVSTRHEEKQSNGWCAACGGQYDRSEAKVFLEYLLASCKCWSLSPPTPELASS